MKKIYLLSLGLLAGSMSFAQSELKPQLDINPFSSTEIVSFDAQNVEHQDLRGTGMCSDTNRWTWGRSVTNGAPTYYATYMHADTLVPNSFGTYINIPSGTSIDVSGFRLYALSMRPDGAPVTVNAVLYAAGADSLPTGVPLATVALSIDTSTTGFIGPMTQQVVFSSPVTLTSSFILSIENSTVQGDSIEVLRGFTGSGAADNFPTVYQAIDLAGGNYTRLPGTSFGARLPHFYPYVSFSQTNNFTMGVAQLSAANEAVGFAYDAPSVTDHVVWSISGFLGDTTSFWSFDGGVTTEMDKSTSHTFVDETKDYDIMLTDSILMWNGSICLMTESQTLLKAYPNGITGTASNSFSAYASNDVVYVSNGIGNATIYSITGTVVKQVVISNQYDNIDVSDLIPGVYILSVNDKALRIKL